MPRGFESAGWPEISKKILVWSHEPDSKSSPWGNSSVNASDLKVLRLSGAVFQDEANFRVRFRHWVNLYGACLNLVALSVTETERRKQEKEKKANKHKVKLPWAARTFLSSLVI